MPHAASRRASLAGSTRWLAASPSPPGEQLSSPGAMVGAKAKASSNFQDDRRAFTWHPRSRGIDWARRGCCHAMRRSDKTHKEAAATVNTKYSSCKQIEHAAHCPQCVTEIVATSAALLATECWTPPHSEARGPLLTGSGTHTMPLTIMDNSTNGIMYRFRLDKQIQM